MSNRWLRRVVAIGGALSLAAAPSFAQTTHIVTSSAIEFSPQNIVIQEGDSIMWTSLMAGNHNVVETDCPATTGSVDNGGFSSGFPGAVDTYTLQFNDAGTICYLCEPHVPVGMFGTITVQAAAPVPTMGEWGLVTMSVLLLGFGAFQLKRRSNLASAVN
ncbi:MAG: plastocyanin [Chlamydiales bacterium]|jgi:plastocyanin